MTRGLSPAATYQTYPAEKKRSNFKEEQHFRRAAVSAALLSRFSQQPFSAALLSSSSQQLFSAFLSSSSQQLFSAFLSSSSQQLFSAALLSSSSQQLFSAIILLWSGVGGQLVTSSSSALLSYHLAVVRGWWSASNIIFSSSSQLIFSAIILLWSGVGGQVCYRSLEGPFRNAFGNFDLTANEEKQCDALRDCLIRLLGIIRILARLRAQLLGRGSSYVGCSYQIEDQIVSRKRLLLLRSIRGRPRNCAIGIPSIAQES